MSIVAVVANCDINEGLVFECDFYLKVLDSLRLCRFLHLLVTRHPRAAQIGLISTNMLQKKAK